MNTFLVCYCSVADWQAHISAQSLFIQLFAGWVSATTTAAEKDARGSLQKKSETKGRRSGWEAVCQPCVLWSSAGRTSEAETKRGGERGQIKARQEEEEKKLDGSQKPSVTEGRREERGRGSIQLFIHWDERAMCWVTAWLAKKDIPVLGRGRGGG